MYMDIMHVPYIEMSLLSCLCAAKVTHTQENIISANGGYFVYACRPKQTSDNKLLIK